MLKKLYQKSELSFAITWIVAYCLFMSVGDSLSTMLNVEKSITFIIGLVFSVGLWLFLKRNALMESYGLCRSKASARSMLYYLPVILLLTANLWHGVKLNYGMTETLLYILSMLCVGFLEEVIFRGLLFNAMRKDNLKVAVIVSSLTFGMGHIINLFNGSGAELIPNLLQVVYATFAGFMFVMMYCKTQSLVGCILIHGVFNALSVFANESVMTLQTRVWTCILLTVITGFYGVYIAWSMKKQKN